jgi:hypothetical protein
MSTIGGQRVTAVKMPGPERIAKIILQIVGPLLVLSAIVALPVCNAGAYSPAGPGDVVTIFEHRSVINAVDEPGVYRTHDVASQPISCQTCSPSAPLSQDSHHARFEVPTERFATLTTTSSLLFFADGNALALSGTQLTALLAAPPSPPPQFQF